MTRDINPEAFTTPIDPAEFNTGGDTTFDIPGYSDPAVLKKQQEEFPEHDLWDGKTIQPIDQEDQQGEGINQQTTDQQGGDQQNVVPQDTTKKDAKPVRTQLDYKIPINEFGKHDVRYLVHRNGQPFSPQKIQAFKLEFPLLDLENQVTELLDDDGAVGVTSNVNFGAGNLENPALNSFCIFFARNFAIFLPDGSLLLLRMDVASKSIIILLLLLLLRPLLLSALFSYLLFYKHLRLVIV